MRILVRAYTDCQDFLRFRTWKYYSSSKNAHTPLSNKNHRTPWACLTHFMDHSRLNLCVELLLLNANQTYAQNNILVCFIATQTCKKQGLYASLFERIYSPWNQGEEKL